MEYQEVWIKLEIMKSMMGVEELLDAIAQALTTDELEDNLRYIDRTHDLNIFEQ